MADEEQSAVHRKVQTHTYTWTVPNWLDNVRLGWSNKFPFDASFETKWELSLKCTNGTIHYSWKLQVRLNAEIWVSLLVHLGAGSETIKMEQILEPNSNLMEVCQEASLDSPFNYANNWCMNIDLFGGVNFKIKLVISQLNRIPNKSMDEYFAHFHKASQTNMSAILNDCETSDLKIITSDAQELIAHKLILKAQCPVFASMFRSQFKENQTGIIEIKDVSCKTMNILLRFFYTGELLPCWRDEDAIVEFVYAVGKYGMNEVLEMLDDVLGTNYDNNVTHQTVLLLDLAQKLSLQVAEKTLLERIIQKMDEIQTTEQMIELFGFSEEQLSRKKEGLPLSEFTNILTLFDNVLGDKYDCADIPFDISLLCISREMSLRNVEVKLLEWLKNAVRKSKAAAELFDLFSISAVGGNEKNSTDERDVVLKEDPK